MAVVFEGCGGGRLHKTREWPLGAEKDPRPTARKESETLIP